MRRSPIKTKSSLTIAFIFACSITLLIAGALLLKLFLILNASTFDGVHQFIVEIDESQGKGVIVAFNPGSSSITILHITGTAPGSFGSSLGIPVDGKVTMAVPTDDSKLVTSLLFQGKNEKGMTIIDTLRLLLFTNSLKTTDFHDVTIHLPLSAADSEKLLPSLFLDNTLYSDNETIAISNATDASGIGTEVARQLSVIGMNVVSVTTALNLQDKTTLSATHENSYTVARIEHLFHVQASHMEKPGIADISLTVGKDSLWLLQ